ncbi:Nuclear receptor corepressor 2, partial [Bienertia sinuspersici]
DLQNPLYLHLSDGPTTVAVEKLKRSADYRAWKKLSIKKKARIRKQIEERFSIVNGSRKYKLNKQFYEHKQNGVNINEYYTFMKIIWEELANMRELPVMTELTPEINAFVKALETERGEHKLFQFLNGLDEVYGLERSQLLMMKPLPLVEMACSYLQQRRNSKGFFWKEFRKKVILQQCMEREMEKAVMCVERRIIRRQVLEGDRVS